MRTIYTNLLKTLLCILLVLTVTYSNKPCFADDPSNIPKDTNQTSNVASTETIVDFSQGVSGFNQDKFWKIQDGELRFIPNNTTLSRFYYNLFQDHSSTDYTISANARWIDGSIYSCYGLIFGYTYDSYFTYLIGNYILLYKYDNGKWKKIKTVKNPNVTDSYDNLEVTCQGSLIQCYLNGKKIFEFKDKTTIAGSVGICTEGNVQCGFKDFRLKKL